MICSPIASPCSNTSVRIKSEDPCRKPEKCTCKKLFKTTVTSWKSGNKCVYCPCCKEDGMYSITRVGSMLVLVI